MLKPKYSVLNLLKNPAYRDDGVLMAARPPKQAHALRAARLAAEKAPRRDSVAATQSGSTKAKQSH